MNKIAPDGTALQGTSEMVPAAAAVVFNDDGEYDHEGGSEVFWDGMVTQTIDGVALLIDEDGADWLEHHLIPEDAESLSDTVIELCQNEIRLGQALEAVDRLCAEAVNAKDLFAFDMPQLFAQRDALCLAYKTTKASTIAAISVELAAQVDDEEEEAA